MPTLINCPSCQRQLRVPDELLGQRVKCPTCGALFTGAPAEAQPPPPTPAPAPAPGYEPAQWVADLSPPDRPTPAQQKWRAREAVSAPAVTLMVLALLGIGLQLCGVGYNALGIGGAIPRRARPQGDPLKRYEALSQPGPIGLVSNMIGLAVSIVILIGAVKMKSLELRGLAITANVLALLPFVSPCCCIGIPVGIWGLTVLNRPEVRDAFT